MSAVLHSAITVYEIKPGTLLLFCLGSLFTLWLGIFQISAIQLNLIFPLSYEIMELRGVFGVVLELHQQNIMVIGVLGWILQEHSAVGDHKILLEGTLARTLKL